LWFGVVIEFNGILHADKRLVDNLTTQERIEPVDNCGMSWTDGTHRTHLAINQFDTHPQSMDDLIKAPLAPALGALAVARVLFDVGAHTRIKNTLAIRSGVKLQMGLLHPNIGSTALHLYKNGYRDGIDAIDEHGCVDVRQGTGLGVEAAGNVGGAGAILGRRPG
jgi:hypothetical protein